MTINELFLVQVVLKTSLKLSFNSIQIVKYWHSRYIKGKRGGSRTAKLILLISAHYYKKTSQKTYINSMFVLISFNPNFTGLRLWKPLTQNTLCALMILDIKNSLFLQWITVISSEDQHDQSAPILKIDISGNVNMFKRYFRALPESPAKLRLL